MRLYSPLIVSLGILWLAASGCKSGDAGAQTAPGPEPIADETQMITNAYLVASSESSGPIEGESRAEGTNARVVRVHTTNESTHAVREEVSFAYQKITWTFEDAGITAEDDWETPVGG